MELLHCRLRFVQRRRLPALLDIASLLLRLAKRLLLRLPCLEFSGFLSFQLCLRICLLPRLFERSCTSRRLRLQTGIFFCLLARLHLSLPLHLLSRLQARLLSCCRCSLRLQTGLLSRCRLCIQTRLLVRILARLRLGLLACFLLRLQTCLLSRRGRRRSHLGVRLLARRLLLRLAFRRRSGLVGLTGRDRLLQLVLLLLRKPLRLGLTRLVHCLLH